VAAKAIADDSTLLESELLAKEIRKRRNKAKPRRDAGVALV
jgi:hypothetical protein